MLEQILQPKISVTDSPLGKNSSYISQYDPNLLFPIPRKSKRDEIGVPSELPFNGFDTWNAYEVSWLNSKGKPVVAIVQFDISCLSKNIIESKSFKLYLNSFNNTKFETIDDVTKILHDDVTNTVQGDVKIQVFKVEDLCGQKISNFEGVCIDDYDVCCDTYHTFPEFLKIDVKERAEETLVSHLLKSNCLVTGQPDWGSIQIKYRGPKIDSIGLLKYIVSYRDHNEFHEQCVERIFMDLMKLCHPEYLLVEARYTRRGGLDINPVRCTLEIPPTENLRLPRQ